MSRIRTGRAQGPFGKPKSARDDICILRYDRSSANNFAQFTRDLEVVAGTLKW
jgi:hypothetical protein